MSRPRIRLPDVSQLRALIGLSLNEQLEFSYKHRHDTDNEMRSDKFPDDHRYRLLHKALLNVESRVLPSC